MKILITTLYLTFLSLSYSAYALVDPDTQDPSMRVVSYLTSAENIEIKSYLQGTPSSLNVTLCKNCMVKTYTISPTATLEYLRQPLNKTELAGKLLQAKHPLIRLGINRSTQEIINLQIGANANDELPLESTTIIGEPSEGIILGVKSYE